MSDSLVFFRLSSKIYILNNDVKVQVEMFAEVVWPSNEPVKVENG